MFALPWLTVTLLLLPFISSPRPLLPLSPVVVTLPCLTVTVTLSPVIVAFPFQSTSLMKLSAPACWTLSVKFAPLWVIQTLHPLPLLVFCAVDFIVDCDEEIDTADLKGIKMTRRRYY